MESMPTEQRAMIEKMQAKMGISMSADGSVVTVTSTQCLTKQNPVPNHLKEHSACRETHEMKGDTVTFHMTCDQNDSQMESTGSATYSGDNMRGAVKSHMVRPNGIMDSTVNITGKYSGPC